ncbi:TonB-dependent receptor [Neomegalonema sp.]|uniref:TonB-dependent receptor plug domain-containing protein n=1 Tax=Neomegalonema sp. TaxID=2039713 RepID=UPI002628A172|nr:TonB-dependent receptor [Neomegalonema sp.]MDD2868529.1 TonB-dependent receptor [Neomegalonema sp.]
MIRQASATAIAVGCAALWTGAAFSQQTALRLDPIILSGGLTPAEAATYARAHTVITGEEIAARGITTVQDALRSVPGVAVSGSGRDFTQIRIRGGEANHTLLLIDGVPAGAGDGEYLFSGLETANIERIEVLRGPQSTFYGSNASSGVINIITKKGTTPGVRYGGEVEVGNGFAGGLHGSARTERGGLSFNFSGRDDRGHDYSGDGGEKDGIERATIGLAGDWRATEDLKLGFTLRGARERSDYDATSWAAVDAAGYVVDDPNLRADRRELTGELYGEYAMLDGRLNHRLAWTHSEFDRRSGGSAWTDQQTDAFKYRASYGLDGLPAEQARHLVNFLAEHRRDSSSANPDYDRDATSLALEYRGSLSFGLDVQAGLRHDFNSVFKDAATWTLGLSYPVANTPFRLHGSAGTGSVNPTYYELYADDLYTVGNPGLKPERNRSFDFGVESSFLDGRGVVDVTYFNERLKNEIAYVNGVGGARSSYRNRDGDSPRQGVEVSGSLALTPDTDLRLSYTWLDASEPDGRVEVRRPKHELSLGATQRFLDGRASVSADLRYVADNYDDQFWGSYPRAKLPNYAVVDLAGTYDLTENLQVFGRVDNLFDKDHSDVWGYAAQGVTGAVGLRAEW